ncbi:expressed unknown protein [Seminavis robusta]|uniref:Uncharacterized protein n=1 Tax=Seminavis robusta TaxID=568900 RepID=A0A9N8HII6_9STRA|nr:expressed unknown protein [Seminavis robusta]|eukprot:Sro625_g177500.1 n/a (787) ;mRNA; r:10315-12675
MEMENHQHSENDNVDCDPLTNNEPQAHDILEEYFTESPCFDTIRNIDTKVEYSHSLVAKSASDAIAALLLLEEFPALAAKHFTGRDFFDFRPHRIGCRTPLYPLAFFVINNFYSKILNRVLRLYPEAINQSFEEWSSLLEYACSDFPNINHQTLNWLASHVNQNFNTARPFLSFFTHNRLENLSLNGPSHDEEILQILLSKSPNFTADDNDAVQELLKIVIAADLDNEIVLQLLEQIPMGSRVLDLEQDLLCSVFQREDETIEWLTGSRIDLIFSQMLPKLSELRLDLNCFEDFMWLDKSGMKTEPEWTRAIKLLLANSSSLQKLSLSIPTDIAWTNPFATTMMKYLIQQHISSTELHLRLYNQCNGGCWWMFEDEDEGVGQFYLYGNEHSYGKVNGEIEEKLRSNTVQSTDEFTNNRFLEFLLNVVQTTPNSTSRGKGKSTIEEIKLQHLENVHAEYLAKLCVHTKSLQLDYTSVISQTAYSPSLCKLWKRPYPNIFSCCGSQAMRAMSSLPCHQNIWTTNATFAHRFDCGASLVKLCLKGIMPDFAPEKKESWLDATSALVTTLGIDTLEVLQFSGIEHQRLELALFGAAVKKNRNLHRLELDGLNYVCTDQRSVLEWFLEMLEGSVNRVLSFLLIGSPSRYHFINFDADGLASSLLSHGAWAVCGRYASFLKPVAVKIQHLLWLAHFGRQRMTNENTTVNDLVEILLKVMSVSSRQLAFAVNPGHPKTTLQPEKDKTGVLYGLLREKPSLWCCSTSKHSHGQASSLRGGKKRKFAAPEGPACT